MVLRLGNYRFKLLYMVVFMEMLLSMPFSYLKTFSLFNVLLNIGRFGALSFEMLLWVRRLGRGTDGVRRYKTFNTVAIGIVLFYLVQTIITLSKKPEHWYSAVINFMMIVLFILFLDRSLKSDYMVTLEAISFYFLIGVVLNVASVFLFKNGLYLDSSEANVHICYFLGVGNQFGKYIFPGCTIIWFTDTVKYGKLSSRALLTICFSTVAYVYVWSATGLIVILCFGLLFMLYYGKWTEKALSWKILLPALLLLFVVVVLQYGVSTFDGLSSAVFKFTGKSTTFSGRTFIWAEALRMIGESPIFGYGKSLNDAAIYIRGYHYSCHDIFLQLLVDGGFVGLILFMFPIIYTMIKTYKLASYNKEIRIIYVGIFSTLAYFFMEVGSVAGLLCLLLVGSFYYCENIIIREK